MYTIIFDKFARIFGVVNIELANCKRNLKNIINKCQAYVPMMMG